MISKVRASIWYIIRGGWDNIVECCFGGVRGNLVVVWGYHVALNT